MGSGIFAENFPEDWVPIAYLAGGRDTHHFITIFGRNILSQPARLSRTRGSAVSTPVQGSRFNVRTEILG